MPKSVKGSNTIAKSLRKDFYIYNEATGFVICSRKMAGKGLSPDDPRWAKAVKKGEFIPIELYQDDPFLIRVLINSDMSKEENAEWLGKFSHKLKISDGRLAICGGIEFIMEPYEEEDSWLNDYVQFVDIAPGDYQADIYTYINSVNRTPLLEMSQKKKEEIGSYFRRTRKNQDFPIWLQEWLSAYPNEDPGHEDEWKNRSIQAKDDDYLHFLLHLTPLPNEHPESAALELGFYNWQNFQARKPEKCPLGLIAIEPQGRPVSAEAAAPAPVNGVEIYSLVESLALTRLDSPCELSLSQLQHAYAIAWYCSNKSHPEIRFYSQKAAQIQEQIKCPKIQSVLLSEDLLSIRFGASDARWSNLGAMAELSNSLSKIDDGTVIELSSIALNSQRNEGCLRLKGQLVSNQWQISESNPELSSASLESALNLAKQADSGSVLTGLDSAKAEQALELFSAEWRGLYKDCMPALSADKLTAPKPDASLMHLYLRFYFNLKFGALLSCQEIEPELIEKVITNRQRNALASNVILEGKGRKFVSNSVNTLDPAAVADAKTVESDTVKIGGRFIGELSCSQIDKFVFRYFSLPEPHTRLVWYRGGAPSSLLEIISDFNDGTSLSTSRQPGAGDDPSKKIFRLRMPNASIKDMYAKHLERAAILEKAHGGYRSFDGSLLECAKRFEEGINKQS